jgi:hypothetical protein
MEIGMGWQFMGTGIKVLRIGNGFPIPKTVKVDNVSILVWKLETRSLVLSFPYFPLRSFPVAVFMFPFFPLPLQHIFLPMPVYSYWTKTPHPLINKFSPPTYDRPSVGRKLTST